MNQKKCIECGLVNFSSASICKRCGKFLSEVSASSSFQENFTTRKDFTDENRNFGFSTFTMGVISSIAPWGLTFLLGINSGKLNALLIIFGLPFVFLGLGVIISPPKTELKAEENKTRNGILLLIGFALGIIETFFFNRALGVW